MDGSTGLPAATVYAASGMTTCTQLFDIGIVCTLPLYLCLSGTRLLFDGLSCLTGFARGTLPFDLHHLVFDRVSYLLVKKLLVYVELMRRFKEKPTCSASLLRSLLKYERPKSITLATFLSDLLITMFLNSRSPWKIHTQLAQNFNDMYSGLFECS